MLSPAEPNHPGWVQTECEMSSPALCSYPLSIASRCCVRYETSEGYCEPNHFGASLCSVSSSKEPEVSSTCSGAFAPSDLPIYGDWSRETGFAYFHPDNCDEACTQARCNNDSSCQGYTWATGAFDGRGAGSLKNSITGFNSWGGYLCKVKVSTCEATGEET